jgi:TolB-like protein
MFKKMVIWFIFMVFILLSGNVLFAQVLTIDSAVNDSIESIVKAVPPGTKIAVINITTDNAGVSDYIVNELIVKLVNTRQFQVVPRSSVELEATKNELDFQMSGFVSDESAKSLGRFLGAGIIITGSFSQESAQSFRLIINAIDVESFVYQSAYRTSIKEDNQIKQLIAGMGENNYEDYTVGQRLGTGTLNILFGLGSGLQGDHRWWIGGGTEVIGAILLTVGLALNPKKPEPLPSFISNNVPYEDYYMDRYNSQLKAKSALITTGSIIAGTGIIIGYIIPFFYHRPNTTNFATSDRKPFSIDLVNDKEISGIRFIYKKNL